MMADLMKSQLKSHYYQLLSNYFQITTKLLPNYYQTPFITTDYSCHINTYYYQITPQLLPITTALLPHYYQITTALLLHYYLARFVTTDYAGKLLHPYCTLLLITM